MEAIESLLTGLSAQVEAQSILLAAQDKKIVQLSTEIGRINRVLLSLKPLDTFHPFSKLPIEIRYEIWRLANPGPRLVTLVEHEMNPYSCVWINRGKRVKVPDEELDEMATRYSEQADGLWAQEICSSAFTRFREEQPYRTPPLLITCHESRSVALTAYAFCMSTTVHKGFRVTKHVTESEGISYADSISEAEAEMDSIASDYVIDNSNLRYRGYRFQPLYDTVHLKGYLHFLYPFLENCEPTELETGNIRSLAIPLMCFNVIRPLNIFLGLEELILIDDSKCDQSCCDGIKCSTDSLREDLYYGKKFSTAARQPQILLMKEDQLSDYVSSRSHAWKTGSPVFEPITPQE